MTRNEIIQYIRQQAVANGVDPDTLVAFANLESNFKLGEKSDKSSAGGVFQFTKDAWKDFGNPQGSKFNLADNTAAAIKFLQHNTDVLQRNGFEASPPNLYVRHFLGSTGGMKFLKAHSKDGGDNLPADQAVGADSIKSNKDIFKSKDSTPRTVGEAYDIIRSRLTNSINADKKAAPSGSVPIPVPQPRPSSLPPRTQNEDSGAPSQASAEDGRNDSDEGAAAPSGSDRPPGERASNDGGDSPSQGSGADEASDNSGDAPPSQPTLSYDPQQRLVPQLAAAMELGATAPSATPPSMLFSDASIAQQPLAPALLNAAAIAQAQPPGLFSDGLVDKQPSSSGYDPSQPLAPALLTEASRLSGPSSPNALVGAPFVAPAQSIFDPVNYLQGLQDVLKPYYQPKDSAADAANAN